MKPLSREDAQSQGSRLQASPLLVPQSKEGRKEIVDCILRNCVDVEHASRTMTAVLDNCTEPRNLTAEIKRAAAETLYGEGAHFDCLRPAAIWDHARGEWKPLEGK